MPDPASPVSMELPEEIAKAIRFLTETCLFANRFNDAALINRNVRNGVEALTAAILSRLREAEAALARVERLEKALQGLEADVVAIRFQVDEKAAFGVAPATFGDDAPYSIGWRHACDAIAAEVRSALSEAPSQGDQ